MHNHSSRCFKTRHDEKTIFRFVIKYTRCKCNDCSATFTPKLTGIKKYNKHLDHTKERILAAFRSMKTFEKIAKENLLTKSRVIQIFDEEYKYISALPLPKVMCLDEIKFSTDFDSKYVLVISDFTTGDIVDILPSRKINVMREYFASRYDELKNVKYLVTDMYAGFQTIHNMYFSKIPHVIDLFHVIQDLSRAVNKIRTDVMNSLEDGSACKIFMKQNWRLFLARLSTIDRKVLDKTYKHTTSGVEKDYFHWMQDCIGQSLIFYHAYQCLQEMYKYNRYSTYEEGSRHLHRIITLLKADGNKELMTVASTYEKNFVGIVNCLDKKSRDFRYSTGIAECINNHIKTLIKISYGCVNYTRFRNRILIISRYNKPNFRTY